jgi:nicotinamidase-related amidase
MSFRPALIVVDLQEDFCGPVLPSSFSWLERLFSADERRMALLPSQEAEILSRLLTSY